MDTKSPCNLSTLLLTIQLKLQKILFFDEISGKCVGKLLHDTEILKVGLSAVSREQQNSGLVVFLDRSKGLFINALEAVLSGSDPNNACEKLASQIDDFSWNNDKEILIAVSEKNLITWFYPRVALFDKELLIQSTSMKAGIDFGERAKIICFDDSTIEIEFEDGSTIQNSVDQGLILLHEYVHENKWNQARKICQFMKTKECWATLASLSLHHGNLNVALSALCALQAVAKVEYIKHVQNIPTEEVSPSKLNKVTALVVGPRMAPYSLPWFLTGTAGRILPL